MSSWFFDGWAGPLRLLVVGGLAYVVLVALLRLSGKRTLSKFNAFDFVVTVAIGSTLSTIVLDDTVPLLEGVAALALLVFLQYAVAVLSLRVGAMRRLVKSEPTLLLHDGRFLERAMRAERVTADEIRSALRSTGVDDVADVAAVVLETNGDLAVIRRTPSAPRMPTIDPVRRLDGGEADAEGA